MDINKLSTPEKIISASAIILLIASFLPWFKVSFLGSSITGNGWDVGFLWGGLPTILGLVMLAHVVIKNFASNVKLPDLPWSKIHLGAGCVAAFLVVLKLVIGESAVGVDLDRSFGLFLAAIAAIGLGAGGFLYFKEDQGSSGPAAM